RMEHPNFGGILLKVEELSHRGGQVIPERWGIPFARSSRRTGVFGHPGNSVGIVDPEEADERREVSPGNADLAGLDAVDLGSRPLEGLGDLFLRQAGRFARPAKGEAKPSTRQRWRVAHSQQPILLRSGLRVAICYIALRDAAESI